MQNFVGDQMGASISNVTLGFGILTITFCVSGVRADNTESDMEKPAVSNAKRRAAKTLVHEGIAAQDAGDYDKAIEFYDKAFTLIPHPILLFNIAQAHRIAGRPAQAVSFYKRYLALDPNGSEASAALEILTEIKSAIDTRNPSIDNADKLTAPGGIPQANGVAVSPGEAKYALVVAPQRLGKAIYTRRWAVWKPWAIGAAGGAIVATGGILHTFAVRNFKAYDRSFQELECALPSGYSQSPGCLEERIPGPLQNKLLLARREQSLAVGAYVAGSTLIAASIVLLYMNRSRLVEPGSAGRSSQVITVSPEISKTMFGIQFHVNH